MKSIDGKKLWGALTSVATFGFAFWVLVSAVHLNSTTLQSIDGPLNGTQLAALQLSTLLTATSAAIFMVSLVTAISLIINRRSCDCPSRGCS
ncbi:hypothetical protein VN12_09690 [Pirellula sp. SH-Sr6A]|nr:hypothetical protein VN12_09690 [Pirellula sp. SH-Sr6A]